MAQNDRDDTEQAQQVLARYKQEHLEDLARARQADTTAEELRRIHERIKQRLQHSGLIIYLRKVELRIDHGELRGALCAHPNIPLDLLVDLLCDGEECLTGFLLNPILPTLLLEQPDFFLRIDDFGGILFFRPLLKRPDVPLILLKIISTLDNPWIALEAQTHIGLMTAVERDWDWLESQVTDLLHRELFGTRRSWSALYQELLELDLLSSLGDIPPPWEDALFQQQFASIAPEDVAEIVAEARRLPESPSEHRVQWLRKLCATGPDSRIRSKYQDDYLLFWIHLVRHPDLPVWVRDALAERMCDWFGSSATTSQAFFWHSIARLSPSPMNADLHARRRVKAIRFATDDSGTRPAIGYRILRELAELKDFGSLPEYDSLLDSDRFADAHFLYRLGLAWHLEYLETQRDKTGRAIPPQELRKRLESDSNCYVRTVVRDKMP